MEFLLNSYLDTIRFTSDDPRDILLLYEGDPSANRHGLRNSSGVDMPRNKEKVT